MVNTRADLLAGPRVAAAPFGAVTLANAAVAVRLAAALTAHQLAGLAAELAPGHTHRALRSAVNSPQVMILPTRNKYNLHAV
jgi:hypothetical protein